MKPYSITEGEFSHAGTSIAHHRDWGNCRSVRDRTADPSNRAAGHARSVQTSHQALGRPAAGVSALWGQAAGVSALWGQAAPPGRNGTSGHRHDFWTSAGAATAFSLSS